MASPTSQAAQPTPANALKAVLDAHRELEKSLAQLGISNNQLPPVGEEKDPVPELDELRRKLTDHTELQNKKVLFVQDKKVLRYKERLLDERQKHVELQANDEIARQVSEEVERQIKEFLPVSLEQQVQEARAHLDKLKTALQNSEARTENGSIQVGDWEEALKVVVMEDGKSSELYPANLGMLYHYEEAEMKKLLDDYGIKADASDEWRTQNMNQFAQFIGVRGQMDVK